MYHNFIQDCLEGDAILNDLDKYIDKWHDDTTDDAQTLQEFLGLTAYEYHQWILTGSNTIFREIVHCRHHSIQFEEYEKTSSNLNLAARINRLEKI